MRAVKRGSQYRCSERRQRSTLKPKQMWGYREMHKALSTATRQQFRIERASDISARLYRVVRAMAELQGLPLTELTKLGDSLADTDASETLTETERLMQQIADTLYKLGIEHKAKLIKQRLQGFKTE